MLLFSNRSQMTSKSAKKKTWHRRRSQMRHWCSHHILTSSVIYHCMYKPMATSNLLISCGEKKKIGNGNVMRFDKTLLVFIVSTVLSWSAGHDYCGLLDGWWASRMFFRFIYLLFLLIDCVFLVKVMSKVQASTEVHLSLLNTKRKTRSLNFDVLLIFRPLHMMCIF